MTLTPQQLQERRDSIGSSDAPTLYGLGYQSELELALDKRGQLDLEKSKPWQDAGHEYEPNILDFARSRIGKQIDRDVVVAAKECPIVSRCDGMVLETGQPVEAKTTGIVGPVMGTWGEEFTDAVPANYIIQVHAQMLCTGADMAYLFALIAGRGIVEFHIERSEVLINDLIDRSNRWWQKHVIEGVDPEHAEPLPLEVAKRLKKEPKSTCEFDEDDLVLVKKWQDMKDLRLGAEKAEKALESMVLMKLGKHELARLPDGRELTNFEAKRKGYTVENSSYRTLRVRKSNG